MRKPAIFLALLLLAVSGARAQPDLPAPLSKFAGSLVDLPREPSTLRGRIYVPAHSSLLVRDGSSRLDLSVTLSVQNTSETGTLVIERIDYFNVDGQVIDRYLPRAIALKPYGAIQIVIPQQDIRGGLGANFVIDWSSPEAIDEPYLEAIMIGGPGTQGHSFVSVGRKVSRP
ncbi:MULTISPECIES: DUF3124 domain-containing protein [unclassified Bradyrhizobium]|uniref:DUF3124 domain-containing protein n=1 Tax=Bradyrhizobium sp. USDA 4541 TaxID=2817704 RepID=UPI0011413E5F|nr:DUF3124 domain-containing protein [Bradyrhizobium sp. USDA 4541]